MLPRGSTEGRTSGHYQLPLLPMCTNKATPIIGDTLVKGKYEGRVQLKWAAAARGRGSSVGRALGEGQWREGLSEALEDESWKERGEERRHFWEGWGALRLKPQLFPKHPL